MRQALEDAWYHRDQLLRVTRWMPVSVAAGLVIFRATGTKLIGRGAVGSLVPLPCVA
jgi:hypothetical protein